MRNSRLHTLVLGLLVIAFCGAGASPPYPSPAEGPQGKSFGATRLYYAMVNGALEKWDFYKDGTFLHQGQIGGSGTSYGGDHFHPGWETMQE